MKKHYLRFRIFLMTLALGLASVFFMNGSLQFSEEVLVEFPQTSSGETLVVFPRYGDEIPVRQGSGCGDGR